MKYQKTFAVLLSALLITTCFADDFNPPDWRGDPLSVEAEWGFENGPPEFELVPDGIHNTVGGSNGETLSGYLTHIDSGPQSYYVDDPDGAGPKGAGWFFDGFVIHIDNWIDNEPYKDIRIQFTGYKELVDGPILELGDPFAMGLDVSAVPLENWMVTDGGWNSDGVMTWSWLDIRIWPNPDREDIWFNTPLPGVIMDQVYVDTISVPEPGTISLLAIGALSLLRKRRS